MMKTLSLFLFFHIPLSFAVLDPLPVPDSPQELYIDLMKKILTNTIYNDMNTAGTHDPVARQNGADWPMFAHTMAGMKRLDNVHACLKNILENNIPGDCVETGVWRGGCTILMRAILKAYNDRTRKVWIADSFEGLPPPNPSQYPHDQGLDLSGNHYLSISLEQVQDNFRKYDLLDKQCVFLKGFFRDTLATAPIDQIALLRLDGDLYESTIQALDALYPKLSIGGYVIIDDYGAISACAHAVHDYRQAHGITEPIIQIDWTGVYWQKNH